MLTFAIFFIIAMGLIIYKEVEERKRTKLVPVRVKVKQKRRVPF